MVEIVQTVRLKPFQTPNHAIVEEPARPRQDGMHAARSIPLHDLDYEAICGLAEEWLREVFSKANRPNPFAQSTGEQL